MKKIVLVIALITSLPVLAQEKSLTDKGNQLISILDQFEEKLVDKGLLEKAQDAVSRQIGERAEVLANVRRGLNTCIYGEDAQSLQEKAPVLASQMSCASIIESALADGITKSGIRVAIEEANEAPKRTYTK